MPPGPYTVVSGSGQQNADGGRQALEPTTLPPPASPERALGELFRRRGRRRAGDGAVTRRGHVTPAGEGRGALAGTVRPPLWAHEARTLAPRLPRAPRGERGHTHTPGEAWRRRPRCPAQGRGRTPCGLPLRPLGLPGPPRAGVAGPGLSSEGDGTPPQSASAVLARRWEKRAGSPQAGRHRMRVPPPPCHLALPAGGTARPSVDGPRTRPWSLQPQPRPHTRPPWSHGPRAIARLGWPTLHWS